MNSQNQEERLTHEERKRQMPSLVIADNTETQELATTTGFSFENAELCVETACPKQSQLSFTAALNQESLARCVTSILGGLVLCV